MTVSFENELGELRTIAEIPDDVTDDVAFQLATDEIKKFCQDRNFSIHYMRTWNVVRDVEENSPQVTQIDVGSHCEFFYISPAIDFNNLTLEGGT